MIELDKINKTFKVRRRDSGIGEAFKSFFSREYDEIKALNNVSFKIGDGETVGYIGPNGAGKSSTIKVMSGILNPDNGKCIINGLVPWKNRIEHVKNIGVVFGQRSQLWWDVPVIDSFILLKDIYKIPDAVYKRNYDELVEILNLEKIIKTPTRQLSLGQRMRCEIAASLLHDPKILFLDEPTIGLDAVSKTAVRNFIKNINQNKKTTVILTTHDMQDIEAITKRILLIGEGTILLDGPIEELMKRNSSVKTLTIEYISRRDYKTITFPEGMSENKDNILDGILKIHTNINKISISDAIKFLTDNFNVTDISIKEDTIEEIIVSLYKEFSI